MVGVFKQFCCKASCQGLERHFEGTCHRLEAVQLRLQASRMRKKEREDREAARNAEQAAWKADRERREAAWEARPVSDRNAIKQGLCLNYLKTGNCRFSQDCRFLHKDILDAVTSVDADKDHVDSSSTACDADDWDVQKGPSCKPDDDDFDDDWSAPEPAQIAPEAADTTRADPAIPMCESKVPPKATRHEIPQKLSPSEAKEVQKLEKKLREIAKIESRVKLGEHVDRLQLDKLNRKNELSRRIAKIKSDGIDHPGACSQKVVDKSDTPKTRYPGRSSTLGRDVSKAVAKTSSASQARTKTSSASQARTADGFPRPVSVLPQAVPHRSVPAACGFHRHLITTGLESMYEGHTIAKVTFDVKDAGLRTVVTSSAGTPVTVAYEANGNRALIDGGWTRLFLKWDTAGTERFVVNAAAWLVNAGAGWSAPETLKPAVTKPVPCSPVLTDPELALYTEFAGITTIDPVHVDARDKFGNAQNSLQRCYDLVDAGVCRGHKIVVLDCWHGEGGNTGVLGMEARMALRKKGFELKVWGKGVTDGDRTFPPSLSELQSALADASQLWVISSNTVRLSSDLIKEARAFFQAGHGLFIQGDNDPMNADANALLSEVFPGVTLSGNFCGEGQVLREHIA